MNPWLPSPSPIHRPRPPPRRGSGPTGRATERPIADAAARVDLVPAAPRLRAPALLTALRDRLVPQSGSDQCSTVATPRNPARA
jgi:hypothetical protein